MKITLASDAIGVLMKRRAVVIEGHPKGIA
jgi:hypothetical protein